jgi:hypothetical protein
MFGRSTSNFDRLLEKATSQLLLEPDWTSIMMICDAIRQGDTNPKYAVAAIKKKFYHTNPHVALYALQVGGIWVVFGLYLARRCAVRPHGVPSGHGELRQELWRAGA